MESGSATEDEDAGSATEMSLGTGGHEVGPIAEPETTKRSSESLNSSNVTAASRETMQAQASTAFLGLDRKAMEAERLARQARKRDRPITPPSPRKSQKLETNNVQLPSGARLAFSTLITDGQQSRKSEVANAANQKLALPTRPSSIKQEPVDEHETSKSHKQVDALKYPSGVVKKTWAFGHPRTEGDIKLEEVLEPLTLHTAVLSAFQWDVEWLMAKLKASTKLIFVMQEKSDKRRQELRKESEHLKSLRLCFPPMYAPINCMHSKLMLLFHLNKLRIAIPSANLLNFDWGETGVMENSVFMIDLPRLENETKREAEELTAFAKELLYFLKTQDLDRDLLDGIHNFDFGATKDMMFVHTVGGTHTDDDMQRTGLPGLARAVRQLNLESEQGLQIDFAASSIGSLNNGFLQSVHNAARGQDVVHDLESTNAQKKANFFKAPMKESSEVELNVRDKIRIYFPTRDTVKSSKAGAAGTICINRTWFEGANFPKDCFRDYISTRQGLLSHNKILFARGKQSNPGDVSRDVAWAYVGSANMSESAWGRVSYDKKAKACKIICRNWECGVLLPVRVQKQEEKQVPVEEILKKESGPGDDSETESEAEGAIEYSARPLDGEIVGMDVFKDVVPPPFQLPAQQYNDREPWYFLEQH